MAPVELERTLVKSPPELWSEIGSEEALGRWLGDVRVESADAPGRLEWERSDSKGVIELVSSGWGTRVRAVAKAKGVPWERVEAHRDLERSLMQLLDHLGASSLQAG
jgi:hypothetical protein